MSATMDTQNIRFSQSADLVIFEADFIPTPEFFSVFDAKDEGDRNYILWVSVADSRLDFNLSDRVNLLADFRSLERSIPNAGAYPNIENTFIEHPNNETSIGTTNLQAIVQDDILARLTFEIPSDGSTVFRSMTFGIEASNVNTGDTYELDANAVDLTAFPIDANGTQQFNFNSTRGFKLNQGNNKNLFSINRLANLDTNGFNAFIAFFGFKIRWEDWLVRNNVPGVFFKAAELNQGLNNDWLQYLETSGYEINFFTEIVASVNNEILEYKNTWAFSFVDYDSNEDISVQHNYFRDSDNTLINVGTDPETFRPLGVILSNEPTRIEIEFTILDAGTWDISNTYGVMTIEIDNGQGQLSQCQISSIYETETSNALRPLTGETMLKVGIDGTNKVATISALIDPDLLTDGSRYRITGRIGCDPEAMVTTPTTPIDTGIYEEQQYSPEYE